MSDMLIQLATACAGSLGFALLFHLRQERLLLASLGGLLAWGIYLLMGQVTDQEVVRYFVASVGLTVYAELLARAVKCPATLFLVTASVPLIPGGALYHTMQYFMEGDFAACSVQGLTTVLLAVAIAVGMLFPTAIFQLVRRVRIKKAPETSGQERSSPT